MPSPRLIHLVDPHQPARIELMKRLATAGQEIRTFASVKEYVRTRTERPDCILAGISTQDSQTLALEDAEREDCARAPIIYLACDADVRLAVKAMKAGAVDFITTPVDDAMLDEVLTRAFVCADRWLGEHAQHARARRLLGRLTPRERAIFARILRGQRNKQIAASLQSQEATVKVHRSRLMRKLEARTLADLLHLGREVETLLLEEEVIARPERAASRAAAQAEEDASPPIGPAVHGPRRVQPSRWSALYA